MISLQKKKYLYNFNWLFVEKIIRIFGGLFVGIWIARYLGPHDFGILSYGLAFIAFFSWASDLGFSQIVVRELTKHPEKSSLILGSSLLMKLIGGAVAIVLCAISISFIKSDDMLVVLVVLLLSMTYIFKAFDVIDYYYQAKILSKYSVFSRNIAFVCSSMLKVYFIIAEYSVVYFVVASVLEALLVGVFLVYLLVKSGHSIKAWHFDLTVAKKLISDGWPLMISIFLISIHMKVDQLMIESMMNIEAVGIYSVAVNLSQAWFFIPSIIVSTLMPYFVSLKERDKDLYQQRLMQLFTFMFWLGVLVGVSVFLVGREAVVFLFGDEYEGAYHALLYNIWGGIFIAQGLACSIWMVVENQQRYRLYVQILAVCVNIISNIILIPMLGITGAAISTFLTYFLATWLFGLFFKQLRPVTLMMIRASVPLFLISYHRRKTE